MIDFCIQLLAEDVLFSWVITNAPTVGIILVFIWFTWRITGTLKDYRHQFDDLREDVDELHIDFGQFSKVVSQLSNVVGQLSNVVGQLRYDVDLLRTDVDHLRTDVDHLRKDVDHLRKDVDQLRSDVDYLRNDVREIRTSINHLEARLDTFEHKFDVLIALLSGAKLIDLDFLKARSPLELTETGHQALVDMGAKNYIDQNLPALIREIELKKFTGAYDVQEYCNVLIWERMWDADWQPVREFVFNHPVYRVNETKSLPLDIMTAVALTKVYLRNKYFEVHPELYQPAALPPNTGQ